MKLENEQIYKAFHKKVTNRENFDFDYVEGFTAELDGDFFVWFWGTADIVDAIFDARFWKKVVPYYGTNPKIRVHNGFINQYKMARDHIHEKAKKYKRAIVTGHSLGAALATLCGLDLQYNFDMDVAIIPSGSPRVGNRHFVRSYQGRIQDTYRFTHRTDLVTRVPPFCFFYKHVSEKIRLGKWRFPIPIIGLILSAADHGFRKYRDKIDEYLGYDK
jgi:predicted lipase